MNKPKYPVYQLTFTLLVAASLSLSLSGCTGARKARKAKARAEAGMGGEMAEKDPSVAVPPNVPPELPEIQIEEKAKASGRETFQFAYVSFERVVIKGKISTDMSGVDIQANLVMRMERGKALWGTVSLGGIEAVRLLATPDSVTIMNRLDRSYQTFTFQEISKTLNLPLTLMELQDFVLSSPGALHPLMMEILTPGGRPSGPDADIDGASFGYTRPGDTVLAVMNVNGNLLRRVEANTMEAKAAVLFQSFKKEPMPYASRVYIQQEGTKAGKPIKIYALMDIETLEQVAGPLEFPFSIPASYKRTAVK